MSGETVKGVVLCTHSRPNNRAVASYMLAKAIQAKPDTMLGKVRAGDLLGRRVEVLSIDPLDAKPVVDYLKTHPNDAVVIDPHVVFPQEVLLLAQLRSVEIAGGVFSLPYNLLNYSMLLDFGFARGIGELGPQNSWNPLHRMRADEADSPSFPGSMDPKSLDLGAIFQAMTDGLPRQVTT